MPDFTASPESVRTHVMNTSPLSIDYSLCMSDGVGDRGGLTDAELDAETPAFERGLARLLGEVDAGRLGFFTLPKERAALQAIDTYVGSLPEGITDVLMLGIGGSSLGAKALVEGLGASTELAFTQPERRRLHLPDNSDPGRLAALLGCLEPRATLVVAVSKSGGTVETAAALLITRQWLAQGLGEEASEHLVVITDPERGSLHDLAEGEGLRAFSIPSNVGGRFSVFTPVGLLPARLLGLDASGLLDGAEAMAEACRVPTLRDNPAGLLATLHVLHQRLRGHGIHVLMPYADALRPFAAWYVQLWAESLGKRLDRRGRIVESGPTPLPAVGATDQHAQGQLFVEGPRDKLVTFVHVAELARDLTIPHEDGDYAYLGGHSLAQLLDYERRGTALALAEGGRPNLTIGLPRLDANSLGALFFLYQAATAIAGELYGVNAFDQPGVEGGKQLAYGLLGREGYAEAGARVRELETARPRRHTLG